MKDHARGADLYGFWLSELTQDTSLQMCEHPDVVDGYYFLYNKFFEEE